MIDLQKAFEKRELLFARLHEEKTDAYRLFQGASEGMPGLTVDRYGPLILAQTFREPLSIAQKTEIEEFYLTALRKLSPEVKDFYFVYNHRGKTSSDKPNPDHSSLFSVATPQALEEHVFFEGGVRFLNRARHSGKDPWIFLDLRAGRRVLKALAPGKSMLNLFSYTCGAGVMAAQAGASEVWNVDFAKSSLEVGRRNFELNEIPTGRYRNILQDCLPTMRQLAGLKPGGRYGKMPRIAKFEARTFDLVLLDPPTWSKSPFGAVDLVGDYPGLFKPALLCTRPDGGKILATHHVADMSYDSWVEILKRCAEKAGRPLRSIERILPDEDFPSFDGQPPLKMVLCEV